MYIVDDSDFMHPHIVEVDDSKVEAANPLITKRLMVYTANKKAAPRYVYADKSVARLKELWNSQFARQIADAKEKIQQCRSRML